jgi:N-acetylglucosamine-6-phosphate deacetylase
VSTSAVPRPSETAEPRRLGVARALVDGRLVDGDVTVADGHVVEVGVASHGGTGIAAPGFVDLQVNGFAGADLVVADAEGYATAGAALAATGVTAYQPTFITGDPELVVAGLTRLAGLAGTHPGGPRLLGAHLEGPWLSPVRPGTHPPGRLRDPDPEVLERFLAAGPVGTVTLAPELPGALETIERLVAAGVLVCCGHTDADAVAAHAAFDAGARSVTHLFNAMRPFTHRDPGIVGVALTRPDVAVPVIVDGIHLSGEAVRLAAAAAGERLVLVTDAVAAAGMPDGSFRLGEVEVLKQGLEVRRADGTLAGSALTMDAAVRGLVELGIDLAAALHAASVAPRRLLTPDADVPAGLAPGVVADVVVLDDHLGVREVLRDGHTIAQVAA